MEPMGRASGPRVSANQVWEFVLEGVLGGPGALVSRLYLGL